MTDPTPEQIEAAARSLWAAHGLNGEWEAGTHRAHEICREDARAALVAAAGATPQDAGGINLMRDLGYDESDPEAPVTRGRKRCIPNRK